MRRLALADAASARIERSTLPSRTVPAPSPRRAVLRDMAGVFNNVMAAASVLSQFLRVMNAGEVNAARTSASTR
jgi:hypothetical protein